jgi:hypothetical protein
LLLGVFFAIAQGIAASTVVEGTITALSDRGYVVETSGGRLNLIAESATRCWRNRSVARSPEFLVNERVSVRYKTGDNGLLIVREIADLPSATWLAAIRKRILAGVVTKTDERTVTAKFRDGTTFAYRATAKSAITVKGQTVPVSSLQIGQALWFKGRTMANMDTRLVSASDVPPNAKTAEDEESADTVAPTEPAPKRAEPTTTKTRSKKILSGPVLAVFPSYRMFDIRADGLLYHITVTPQTEFRLAGKRIPWSEIEQGMDADVTFRRDRVGRFIALRVDLS